jgi:tRNA pseudouridine13 synthase
MMYVHAYQSYIWNSVVSERMRMYGCEAPVVGDIVLNVPEDTVKEAVEIEDADEKDEPAVAPEAQSGGRITKQSLLAASKTPKVKVLTEEDLPKYTIYDVVLPLPGFSVTYPTGQTGELYKKMLEADGLDIDNLFRPQK